MKKRVVANAQKRKRRNKQKHFRRLPKFLKISGEEKTKIKKMSDRGTGVRQLSKVIGYPRSIIRQILGQSQKKLESR